MWWLIILTLHKSFIVCQIQSPQATWATDFYKSTFQRCKSTIHIIFNYVRAEQDHCLYNITGWRKWDSALLPSELTGSRWRPSVAAGPSTTLSFTEQEHAKPLLGLAAVTGGCLGKGGVASPRGRRTRAVIAVTGLLLQPNVMILLIKRRKIKSCYSREVNPFLPQATK